MGTHFLGGPPLHVYPLFGSWLFGRIYSVSIFWTSFYSVSIFWALIYPVSIFSALFYSVEVPNKIMCPGPAREGLWSQFYPQVSTPQVSTRDTTDAFVFLLCRVCKWRRPHTAEVFNSEVTGDLRHISETWNIPDTWNKSDNLEQVGDVEQVGDLEDFGVPGTLPDTWNTSDTWNYTKMGIFRKNGLNLNFLFVRESNRVIVEACPCGTWNAINYSNSNSDSASPQ